MRGLIGCLGFLLVTQGSFPQQPSYQEGKVYGRDAYMLESRSMRVSALRGAGHLAEIRFKSSDPNKNINPMRVPHFQTIDPWEYDPVEHEKLYGGGANRWLQAGYLGHLLNFPTFGGPSSHEEKNGLGTHGEAVTVEWTKDAAVVSEDGVRFVYSAYLPQTQYNVGRVLTLPADETVLYVEEWVENLLPFDRPVHWVQHATLGPPFVEPGKNVLDVSATKGELRGSADPSNSLRPGPIQWPYGTSHNGEKINLREMQARPHAGTYYGLLMDPKRERSFFTMYHKDYKILIGYIWHTKDFPWIGDWQENKRNTTVPWNGKVIARGMEFGTTPFGGPMQQVVQEGELYGVPLYRWIGGRERATVHYVVFLTEIPSGFQGVENVRVENHQIIMTERKTGKTMALKSELSW